MADSAQHIMMFSLCKLSQRGARGREIEGRGYRRECAMNSTNSYVQLGLHLQEIKGSAACLPQSLLDNPTHSVDWFELKRSISLTCAA